MEFCDCCVKLHLTDAIEIKPGISTQTNCFHNNLTKLKASLRRTLFECAPFFILTKTGGKNCIHFASTVIGQHYLNKVHPLHKIIASFCLQISVQLISVSLTLLFSAVNLLLAFRAARKKQ